MNRNKRIKLENIFVIFLIWFANSGFEGGEQFQPEFSTAGFHELEKTGREVSSMNVAWRFHKGPVENGHDPQLNDAEWKIVNLPHGIEYLPAEASGSINYQGEVWYRKHFKLESGLEEKKIFLHFEAIMGKSKIWVNGELLKEHFGGYLPAVIDISRYVKKGEENVIAVMADNSDDANVPPGKPQKIMDFTYFGGIYRDCWLITHNDLHISDPNYVDEPGGGGLVVAYDSISESYAKVSLKLHAINENKKAFTGRVVYELYSAEGYLVTKSSKKAIIGKGEARHIEETMGVEEPNLWTPETPYLYNLHVYLKDSKGNVVDGYRKRIGIRKIEFKGEDGLWLNGRPYEKPLIGANRHQDFAVVGNAVPNSVHWRDAKKLRDVGLKVIRNAHYPQDPAFMDACDELGLFVIVNTPGWQFWNDAPIFEERMVSDIRNMIRRDRNHPSILFWEPLPNETRYPARFAKKASEIVHREYLHQGEFAVSEAKHKGSEYFSIHYAHPPIGNKRRAIKKIDPDKAYFTREWGDNVDDWNAHNSPSRVHRSWGETPMLIQSRHYASPPYQYTSYDVLYKTSRQHIGGALWHPFDHQRGYHPDPFYGGLMDIFRQPKYSYYMFMAQRDPFESSSLFDSGPMVYIAHEMTPFSPSDVEVYSNCEEVRLTVFEEGGVFNYEKKREQKGMPSPIITFENAYDFMADKKKSRSGKQDEVYFLAEGLIDGEVVATHKVFPARRPSKLILWEDNEGVDLVADGSDFTTVVAAVADRNGNIKRLNNYYITFEVEGKGSIIGDDDIFANPRPVNWGTAPALIRATTKPGEIKLRARVKYEGINVPLSAEIILQSSPSRHTLVYSENELLKMNNMKHDSGLNGHEQKSKELIRELEKLRKELNLLRLKEVERDQDAFGEDRETK